MKAVKLLALAGLMAGSALSAQAAEVKITGTHLCCGACVKDVEKTLKTVTAVSNLKVDREAETITFEAADKKGARQGVRALALSGFGGKAMFEGQEVKLPATGAEPGAKADKVVLTGVHLCCGGCVTAVKAAVEKVPGVKMVAVDREAKTVTLTGTGIEHTAAAKAIGDSGFYGKIEGAKPKTNAKKAEKPTT